MAKENNSVVTENVKIFAFSMKHKEKPFYATGVTDNKTKQLLTGMEHLSQKEIDKLEFKIDPMENYMIRHNDSLVLEKKGDVYIHNKDYVLYNFYKTQPNIAQSFNEAVKGVHDFYLQNFEEEANKKIEVSKLKAKAGGKVADLNLTDMNNLLYFFGENAALLSSRIAEARVYELAESDPAGIVRYFDDLENNLKVVFIKKLLSKGFIKKGESGYLMFNKVILGANEEEAAAYVYDNKHESVYIPLKDMLDKSN